MSEPEIKPKWVALAAEVNRKAQCWNCNEEDGCDCMRAVLAAVAPLIRADERERCAKVGRGAVMRFRHRVNGRYYAGYHEDMREHVASAIRAGKP